LAGIRKNQTKN